jgi:hypothetical protein
VWKTAGAVDDLEANLTPGFANPGSHSYLPLRDGLVVMHFDVS